MQGGDTTNNYYTLNEKHYKSALKYLRKKRTIRTEIKYWFLVKFYPKIFSANLKSTLITNNSEGTTLTRYCAHKMAQHNSEKPINKRYIYKFCIMQASNFFWNLKNFDFSNAKTRS